MLPHAAQLILLGWIGIGLLLIGLGAWFRLLCGAPANDAEGLLRSFWLGWALLLFLLQAWHLFLPVDLRALVVVSAMAVGGLLLGGWRPWIALMRGAGRHWLAIVMLVPSALWLSNRAMGGPHFGDVGLYHIPVVQWDRTYAIIPGLGNLFVPFGHNLSYFLYVALLDVGPFVPYSSHLVNSILVLALFARALLGFDRVVHLKRVCRPDDVFYALLLPVLVLQAAGIFLTSPSPDQPIFMLGVVLSGELLGCVGRLRARRVVAGRALNFDILAITLLATAAITVKISIAGLAAAVLFTTIAYWLWRERPFGRNELATLGAATTLGILGGALWVLGNIILTGCPLYPSAFAALPVDWRVRADAVKWIDRPMEVAGPLWKVIWDWRWFLRCLDSLGWSDPEVMLPLAIVLAAMLLAVVARVVWRHPAARRLPMVIVLPAVASFAFCFANAPMPRYVGATLWVLAIDSVLLALGTAAFGVGRLRRVSVVTVTLLGVAGALIARRPVLLPLHDFEPRAPARVQPERLASGLVVQVPRQTQTCWDAPLPCTPEPNPALRLRRPGDLASGFVVDAPAQPAISGREP